MVRQIRPERFFEDLGINHPGCYAVFVIHNVIDVTCGCGACPSGVDVLEALLVYRRGEVTIGHPSIQAAMYSARGLAYRCVKIAPADDRALGMSVAEVGDLGSDVGLHPL